MTDETEITAQSVQRQGEVEAHITGRCIRRSTSSEVSHNFPGGKYLAVRFSVSLHRANGEAPPRFTLMANPFYASPVNPNHFMNASYADVTIRMNERPPYHVRRGFGFYSNATAMFEIGPLNLLGFPTPARERSWERETWTVPSPSDVDDAGFLVSTIENHTGIGIIVGDLVRRFSMGDPEDLSREGNMPPSLDSDTVWRVLWQAETNEGTVLIRVPTGDAAVRELIDSCIGQAAALEVLPSSQPQAATPSREPIRAAFPPAPPPAYAPPRLNPPQAGGANRR